jgi:hypothetical protein
MVKRRRLALGVAMMLVGALAACSSIWGFETLSPLPPDASIDGRADAHEPDVLDARAADGDANPASDAKPKGDASDASCVPAVPPPATTSDDDSSADMKLIFALHTLDLGLDGGDVIGYDLDTVCTCPGPSSCNLPALALDGQACDRPGGRDVASARLFGDLGVFDSRLGQPQLNEDLAEGTFTFLVRLGSYNGAANDSSVTLEFFNSPGSENPPAWDGSDSWYIYDDNVASGTDESSYVATFIDFDAYVSNYTVVGHFPPSLTIRLSPDTGGNDNYLELPLSGSVLTAALDPTNPASVVSSGTFSARMSSHELLGSFQALENGGSFLCGDSGLYGLLASEVCPAQDIMTSPGDDNTDASCNAVSFAIGFTAAPAHLGSLYTPTQVAPSCPPGWSPTCGM